MSAPKSTRSTAGFRSLQLFELNAAGLPVGVKTLEACSPFTVTSDAFTTVLNPVAAGTTVAGTVPYYGVEHSGVKLLTITAPAPRIIPHIGSDGVFALQVLPPNEPVSGELHVDKTSDVVSALVQGINVVTVGEANLMGEATSQQGYEPQLAALAYSFAEDTTVDSPTYGAGQWDSRIMPRVNVFQRETGYGAEDNERLFSFTPGFTTTYPWGIQYTLAVEKFTRSQLMVGSTQYKPAIVSWVGNGSVKAFPFDGNKPAALTTKVNIVTKNGVLCAPTTDYVAYTSGIIFTTAPAASAVVVCFYEYA